MEVDYIIVGQGIAGSVVAFNLLRAEKRIAIIDRQHFPTASSIAAGLINPFTGPKMVKSWKFDELIDNARTFYSEAEKSLKSSFFGERKLFRPFLSVEEQNDWYGKSTLEGYREYIIRICDPEAHSSDVFNPIGGIETKCWVLNLPVFLAAVYEHLKRHCKVIEEEFEEDALEIIGQEGIRYRDIISRRIIFCTGFQAIHSRWFGWLPFAPVKGEVLEINMEMDFETIYNRNCFIIPQGEGKFKVGSNYDRNDLAVEPTIKARNQIMSNLHQLTERRFDITGHWAGIRPGTLTRRPLIGQHPVIRSMYIFNGLGTKGVSLAPYFANEFVNNLERGNYLLDEVNIEKYYSLYFNSQSEKKNNT